MSAEQGRDLTEQQIVEAARERDARIEQLICAICRRAGGQNDDPPPSVVDHLCKEYGLWISVVPPA